MSVHIAEQRVIKLSEELKHAKAELAAARKVEREANEKRPLNVEKAQLLCLKLEVEAKGWSIKLVNRKGKVYVSIDVTNDISLSRFLPPYALVESFFPKAHLTSGGCGHYTFRLNP